MENRSDSSLYERLVAGEKRALGDVYLAYKNEFLFYFKKFDISDDVLLDIYQDSIIVVYQKFVNEKVKLEKSSLKTYIFGIGKNKLYNHFKTNKKKNIDVESLKIEEDKYEVEDPSPYEIKLSKKLNEISESCRHVLELFYYRSFTIKEIVEATDYKDENTVKSHKSRCLKRLRELCKSN